MKYEKPEVMLVGAAMQAIQCSNKSSQHSDSCNTDEPGTSSAYEADE